MRRYVRGAAAALAGWLLLLAGCSSGDGDYAVVTPTVDDTVERTVEDTGTVGYAEEYSVTPAVSGKILSCAVEEGDPVTEGQALYTIDSGELEDQIDQARISLDSAQASLAQAQDACADLNVTSYVSGTVTSVSVHVGDFVSSGTPVAQVEDNRTLTLTVPFWTEDAAGLSPGQSAVISFPARGETVTGTVSRVYDTPTALPGGREGVYVELSFQNPGAVLAGESASASVGSAACLESGTVEASAAQSIYAAQSGQILTLDIQTGSAVTSGQVVATIDNASLTNAAENAALSLRSAQVSLEQLEDRLDDYSVTAPTDGVVLSRSFKTGDFAAAGTPLATLARSEDLCVHADIDELYINEVGVGQTARITFTGDQGDVLSYEGTVTRVNDAGVTSGGVTNYTVEITLDNAGDLRYGMNVMVEIITARREGCMTVPASAVSGSTVQVLENGSPADRTVETGLTGGGVTEILSGLSPEDQVIVPGS